MIRLNDVHSRLNATPVAAVAAVSSLDEIRAAIAAARARRLPVIPAGGRHAMGGQQFCRGGIVVDTRPLDRVLGFDPERGLVEVEAGIQWPQLQAYLAGRRPPRWGIAQKQTGANRLSIGGAVSANVHGRGLSMRPFVGDVERLVLVDAAGDVHACSRDESGELFRLAVGGYGLFGVVYSTTIRLAPVQTVERVVELERIERLSERFEERIAAGFLYGDFQFAVDPASEGFLRDGVFSCYRPVPSEPVGPRRELSLDDWRLLLHLAHTGKSRAFELYARHYMATNGQLYLSDEHQFAGYADGYHEEIGSGSEMISELYVPRDRLADFMAAAGDALRAQRADVIYGTVRLIERDHETFLPWARDRYACVIFNLHVEHESLAIARAAEAFRLLIDLAIARGGSYYLTYHRWARRDQLEACYPQFGAFLEAKERHDPNVVFQSDWYRDLRALWLAEAKAA